MSRKTPADCKPRQGFSRAEVESLQLRLKEALGMRRSAVAITSALIERAETAEKSVAALEQERDEWREKAVAAYWDARMRALASLSAQNRELRGALERLDPQCLTTPACGSCVGCDARAALSSPAPEEALRAAIAAEREACAQVAENGRFLHDDAPDARFGKECAAAIRRREVLNGR